MADKMKTPDLSKINTVFYDWDGCMVQSLQMWLDINLKLFKDRDNPNGIEEILRIDYHNHLESLTGLGIKEPEKYREELIAEGHKRIANILFHKNAIEAITELHKRGFNLGIVSMQKKHLIEEKLKDSEIADFFTSVIAQEDVTNTKPDPEGVNISLEKFGIKPQQALIIGDSPSDINAARNSGITSILYIPRINEELFDYTNAIEQEPDMILKDHAELLDHLPAKAEV